MARSAGCFILVSSGRPPRWSGEWEEVFLEQESD